MKSFISCALAGLGLTLVVTGCANTDKAVASNDTAGKVCSVSYKTGSNMPSRECHEPVSDADRELARQQMRDGIRVLPPTK